MQAKSRVERKKAKTKNKIFQAAIKLFLEQGYENTTVEQIAANADVAKGTFFNYFPTKDAIVYYLGEQRVMLMQDMLENELKNIDSCQEKILRWLEVFGQENEKDKEIIALIVNVVFTKLFYDAKPEWHTQWLLKGMLAQIVRDGQARGEFRKDFDAEHVADIFISIYFATLFQWLEGQLKSSLTNEYMVRAQIVLQGINLCN